jgi:hypothetical protein
VLIVSAKADLINRNNKLNAELETYRRIGYPITCDGIEEIKDTLQAKASVCKGQVKPVGLIMKKGRNKYQIKSRGELMLVHECTECGRLSIHRIAADDDSDSVMEAFFSSLHKCKFKRGPLGSGPRSG